jgi:ABC-type sugar transport system substrate-binding protein
MRKNWLSLFLLITFSLALTLTTVLNILLIGKSREELGKSVLRNPASLKTVKKHFIAILPAISDPFFINLYYGIQQGATKESAGLELLTYSSEVEISQSFLSAEAYRFFDIALRSKPDGVVMYFPPGSDIKSFSSKAQEKQVPFVPIAMDQPVQGIPALVTSDSFTQGSEAVSTALGLLGKDARIGVILPAGNPNSFIISEEPFLNGAIFELNRKHQGKIVAAEREEENILGGEAVCTNMIEKYPELNCFICTNARSTVSAAQVIIDRGLVGKIVIIGADEDLDVARLLEKGIIQATIVRDAIKMGETAVFSLTQKGITSQFAPISKVSTYTKYGNVAK